MPACPSCGKDFVDAAALRQHSVAAHRAPTAKQPFFAKMSKGRGRALWLGLGLAIMLIALYLRG